MRLMTLEDMMNEHLGRQEQGSAPLPEAQIMELRAAAELYKASQLRCAFRPGDLVTPRANSPLHDEIKGLIFIVLEIFGPSIRNTNSDAGEWPYYGPNDIRVARWSRGAVVPHMGESWMFEPYTGEGATETVPA